MTNGPEITLAECVLAPKVLLHDHLDGGLRPGTVADLARENGYDKLPADTPEALAQWFATAADSGSLERYLETFAHTVAVMQTGAALTRVARECAEDLAADGVGLAVDDNNKDLMTPEILAAVETATAGITDGSITVHDYTVDNSCPVE